MVGKSIMKNKIPEEASTKDELKSIKKGMKEYFEGKSKKFKWRF